MCGLIGKAGFTGRLGLSDMFEEAMTLIRHRGPDAEGVKVFTDGTVFGHTRLSIIDLDDRSNQPFEDESDITLIYNGELWNYKELRKELEDAGEFFRTESDTEVVARLLSIDGVQALKRFQGMFAVAWKKGDFGDTYIARDRFGEVPLHYSPSGYFASEIKPLLTLGCNPKDIKWVEPGTVIKFHQGKVSQNRWYRPQTRPITYGMPRAAAELFYKIKQGTEERLIGDVPMAVLLSGGIDSSAVAFHAAKQSVGLAYTAVFEDGSADHKAARLVAEKLNLQLVEVKVPAPSADDLKAVVRHIEMPHKAQVEIGWACLFLARAMMDDGIKVVLSGEGSDELWASYGMSYHGIQRDGWDGFRQKTFVGQHRKNFARCNKIFMSHGVECRLPFLNTELAEFALSLPESAVKKGTNPKAVMSQAYEAALPESICNRKKVAFQDKGGLGLKDFIAQEVSDDAKAMYLKEFNEAFMGVKA